MLDVLSHNFVVDDAPPAAPPHFCERPRVALESGRVVAHTVHFSTGVAAATALGLACSLARCHRMRVSIPVTGPLSALPVLVETALSRAGLAPDQLEIAISAAALERAGIKALLALSALRDDGVDVALTGFGVAGIDLIARLPLSGVILAPGAVRDVPGSASAIGGLRDLLAMAADHALRVTATGIVSETQRAVLSGLGADAGEGPLFGPIGANPADPPNLA